jgi:hypothetical protein
MIKPDITDDDLMAEIKSAMVKYRREFCYPNDVGATRESQWIVKRFRALEKAGLLRQVPESYNRPKFTICGLIRCPSVSPPPDKFRCGLEAGHDGDHTVFVPSNMPWYTGLDKR